LEIRLRADSAQQKAAEGDVDHRLGDKSRTRRRQRVIQPSSFDHPAARQNAEARLVGKVPNDLDDEAKAEARRPPSSHQHRRHTTASQRELIAAELKSRPTASWLILAGLKLLTNWGKTPECRFPTPPRSCRCARLP
jgi:hypothetical protein